MEEKTTRTDGQFEKYPYSFELRVNDNIVCQRYFRIGGFNQKALSSAELTDTIKYCGRLIYDSLKSKTQLYYEYTAPQIFKNVAEMREWERCQTDRDAILNGKYQWKIEPLKYVIFEDEEDVYFWSGYDFTKFNGSFDRDSYLPGKKKDKVRCDLKLAFLYNDTEICSVLIDASEFPRFIRTNIDLSSSRNRYRTKDTFQPFEASMIDIINEKHEDLIPVIKKELAYACSDEDIEYTRRSTYGKKTYKHTPSWRIVGW